MSSRLLVLRPEEIAYYYNKVNDPNKYNKRRDDFVTWINSFIQDQKDNNVYPEGARLMGDASSYEMAVFLNHFYWAYVEGMVRENLKISSQVGEKRLNRYKIAAATEYVVMSQKPFEDKDGNSILELNVEFAVFLVSHILLAWEYDGEIKDALPLNENIIFNKNIREFIIEHKGWLKKHILAHNEVVFSNMQTIRLYHCLLHATIDERFIPYQTHT